MFNLFKEESCIFFSFLNRLEIAASLISLFSKSKLRNANLFYFQIKLLMYSVPEFSMQLDSKQRSKCSIFVNKGILLKNFFKEV